MEQCCGPHECRATDERFVDSDQHKQLCRSVRNIKSPELLEECKWCSCRRSASEPSLWSCKCGDASLCGSVILVQCYALLDSTRHTSATAFHLPLNLLPCTILLFILFFSLSFASVLRVIQYAVWTCHLEFLLVQRLSYCSLTLGQGSYTFIR
jgi:hypothetical protein